MEVSAAAPYSPQVLSWTKQDVELLIHHWQRRTTQPQDEASRYQRLSNLTTSERVTSVRPVLRKHEKSYALAMETESTGSRAHRIRDSKRFYFTYWDSKIARFEHLNIRSIQYPHHTEKGWPRGKWLFKEIDRVLAFLLREVPEDGRGLVWSCTTPSCQSTTHKNYSLTAPAPSSLTPWNPTGSLTHCFLGWQDSFLKYLPVVLRCTGISLSHLNFRAFFSESVAIILQHNSQLKIYLFFLMFVMILKRCIFYCLRQSCLSFIVTLDINYFIKILHILKKRKLFNKETKFPRCVGTFYYRCSCGLAVSDAPVVGIHYNVAHLFPNAVFCEIGLMAWAGSSRNINGHQIVISWFIVFRLDDGMETIYIWEKL